VNALLPRHHALRRVVEAALPRRLLVARGPRGQRRIALTFDDGPGELTRAYLETLERHGARATFFVVGAECAGRAPLLAEMLERGHELAGHGYSHERFPVLAARGELESELAATRACLPGQPRRVRPPYGALSVGSLRVCARAGVTVVLWSVDSEDWRRHDPPELVQLVSPHTVEPGSIVLMHEGQPWTLDALAEIVPALRRSGYDLVTVGELLAA